MGPQQPAIGLKGADLRGKNLYSIKASNAFLVRANLEKINLAEIDLREADLTESNLKGAFLFKADLIQANLSKAVLSNANFQEAILEGANLQEANLLRANVQFSMFFAAKGLKADQIKNEKDWKKALYDPEFINTWSKEDRENYIGSLSGWLPDAADIHFNYLPEKTRTNQLNKWYCLYKLPQCKKPESKKKSSSKPPSFQRK